MKNFKINSSFRYSIVFLFLIVSIIIHSCSKVNEADMITISFKKDKLSQYNQKLLDDFFVKTRKYFKDNNALSTRSADDMLQFSDFNSYNSYNQDLNILSNQWDVTNGLNSSSEFIIVEEFGDPALNAVDDLFAHESLRLEYEQALLDVSTPSNYVNDPYLQRNMNQNEEVEIGNYIYKYLGENVMARIILNDINSLNSLRNYPEISNLSNVDYLNFDTGIEFPRDVVVQPRGACNLNVLIKPVIGTTQVDVDPALFTSAGIFCGASYKYNFGDGTGDIVSTNKIRHFFNLNGAISKEFNITIVATPICSDCGTTPIPFSRKIVVSNAEPCDEGSRKVTNKTSPNIVYLGTDNNNHTLRFVSELGVRGKQALFASPKIWSKTELQILNNGKWKSVIARNSLTTGVSGATYVNSCVDRISTSFTKSKKTYCIEEIFEGVSFPFGVRKSGDVLFQNSAFDIGITRSFQFHLNE